MAKKKNKVKSRRKYFIGLAIYCAVLSVICAVALSYVWKYAEEYQASRPELVMHQYIEKLNETRWTDSMTESVKKMEHKFQTDEECVQIIKDLFQGEISFSQTSTENVQDAEGAKTYLIRCDSGSLGKVTIVHDESKADQVKFGMLPYRIYSEKFDFTGLYTSVDITAPDMYKVLINGQQVGKEYIVEGGIHYNVLEQFYASYPTLPTKATYHVDNIVGNVTPQILDEDGNEVIIDPEKDDSQFISYISKDELAKFNEFVVKFTDKYTRYTAGVGGTNYNYQELQLLLKPESDLAIRMEKALDGLSNWSHTSNMSINSVTLNSGMSLGENNYLLDVTYEATATTPQGENNSVSNYYLIVTTEGNGIQAIMLENH